MIPSMLSPRLVIPKENLRTLGLDDDFYLEFV
jgi:hypothetical protein